MTQSINTNDLLNAIKQANQAFKYEVTIPSIGKTVPFSEITTSQQKKLIKSIIDSEIYNTEFILCMYEIIRENCGDSTVDVSSLTILDKLLILIKMRIISIGPDLKIELPSKIDEEVQLNATIDLNNVLKAAEKKIKHIKNAEYTTNGYSIICGLPTIEDEYKLESQLRDSNKDIEINDIDELRTNIGEKFIGEVSKYIKVIKVPTEDGELSVSLNELTFIDRIKIIEQLPARCLDEALQYIKDVDEQIQQVTLHKSTFTHKNKEKEKFEYNISIDSSFFIAS